MKTHPTSREISVLQVCRFASVQVCRCAGVHMYLLRGWKNSLWPGYLRSWQRTGVMLPPWVLLIKSPGLLQLKSSIRASLFIPPNDVFFFQGQSECNSRVTIIINGFGGFSWCVSCPVYVLLGRGGSLAVRNRSSPILTKRRRLAEGRRA